MLHARGTGARERLGLVAIAVEAEKEVLSKAAAWLMDPLPGATPCMLAAGVPDDED